ncbi:putative mitochondrial protein [Sesamum angolense]|uniref:Mitochondrial protein n=1 Tax=Sesamum angolense TaxID=2727404 RepID=A0AAE2BP85_9LAMI|nr:putative mitochondrial protein [Sesamum angolense]
MVPCFPRSPSAPSRFPLLGPCPAGYGARSAGTLGSLRFRKRFRFEAAWLQEPECEDIIARQWRSSGATTGAHSLRERLAALGVHLSGWGWLCGKNTRDRIGQLEKSLVALRSSVVTAETKERELRAKEELAKLITQEEVFWKQRSKILWLKEGDRNTSFFHAKASQRYQTNSIRRLQYPDGSWAETDEEIRQCILNYFGGVFTSSRPLSDDIQRGTEHLPFVVTTTMVEDLRRPFTEIEVTTALFNMSPLKSPGLDSMPPLFFQKFWHIVKTDVITCVMRFLNNHILPVGFNETNIVHIPKCKQPRSLTQYRPISLCNVVYKIASKTRANRLKPWLDYIISPSQSAFVPGHLITDNVLLAFETNHFLNVHSKGRKHFMNLKLDISKAYDRVEWSFLREVLGKFGFPSVFIELIMLCVSSVSYSFVLRGAQFGSLIPQRGLHQGDPLSPYLFLLCIESLSSLFRVASESGVVLGVAVCRGAPRISHLLFADDTMVFCLASPQTIQHVRLILDMYRLASGQKINLQKSSATFSRNTPPELQHHLADMLGICLENKHEIYLGLPAMAFRSRRALFAALKDRIWRRKHGWHEKILSQAGKVVLIQAVVQAIPSYAMSCFLLPRTLLKEFQSLAANYFWHDGDRRRIHWLAWDKLCASKLEGGLGFQNLEAFNRALLAKQLWRILSRPDSLVSQVLKAKYFPHTHLFDAHLGTRPSFTWRSIFMALPLLRSGCRWRIGTGQMVSVWKDPRLSRAPSFCVITPPPLGAQLKVCDLILEHTREWDVEAVQSLFWPEDSTIIIQIALNLSRVDDLLVWHYSGNGLFSVRNAYHLALSLAWQEGSSREQWCSGYMAMPFDKFYCPFCGCESETPIHTLVHCVFSRQVVDFARSYLVAFAKQGMGTVHSRNLQHSSWSPPPGACIKLNFDGAVLDGGMALGAGVVGRTNAGECLAWISTRIDRGGSAEVTEAYAAREACRFTCQQQWEQVIVEGDCASLLSKLLVDQEDFSVVGPVVRDIRAFSAQIQFVSFSLVRLSRNSVADFLAKHALNLSGDSSCLPPRP